MWYSRSFSNEGIVYYSQYKAARDVISAIDTKFTITSTVAQK